MNRFIVAYILCLISINEAIAQRNQISLRHSTNLSILQFEDSILDFFERNSGIASDLHTGIRINKPLITSSVEYSYARLNKKNIQVGFWLRKIVRGVRTSYTHRLSSPVDTTFSNVNYGGIDLVYRMKSHEVGLLFGWRAIVKNNTKFTIKIKPAIDVYDKLELKSNTFYRDLGFSIPTGNERRHFNSNEDNFVPRFFDNLDNNLFRTSLYINTSFSKGTIVKGVSLVSGLNFGFSTPLFTKDRSILSFLPDGWILLFNVDFAVAYEF